MVNQFVNFMYDSWSFLLKDHTDFWLAKLPQMAQAISNKITEKYGITYRPFNEAGGFNVFGFIDNTLNATCRPKGGPARAGKGAPRNDESTQRAFYTGTVLELTFLLLYFYTIII